MIQDGTFGGITAPHAIVNIPKSSLVLVFQEMDRVQIQLAVSVTLGNNTGAVAGFSNSVPILVEGPHSALGCCQNYVNGIYPPDLYNDGTLDLVVDAGYNVLSLLGNGNGTCQSPVETAPYLIPAVPETLQFADVTGGGCLDVIDASDSTSVSPGNGDNTFGPAISNYAFPAHLIWPRST